jgi:hypothetical protein
MCMGVWGRSPQEKTSTHFIFLVALLYSGSDIRRPAQVLWYDVQRYMFGHNLQSFDYAQDKSAI